MGMKSRKSAAQVRERVHAHRCFSENCSDSPDYDVHHQHVSNQPDHTHDGVESGDDDGDDDRVGVVFRPALRVAAWAVACVGQVLAEGAAVVVQKGQLATEKRAVACALHGFWACTEGAFTDRAPVVPCRGGVLGSAGTEG